MSQALELLGKVVEGAVLPISPFRHDQSFWELARRLPGGQAHEHRQRSFDGQCRENGSNRDCSDILSGAQELENV